MSKQSLPEEIDTLYNRIIEVFSKESEINEIYTFGSIVKGTYDRYSDIDIEVVTSDYYVTLHKLRKLLEEIDDPISVLNLFYENNKSAYSVLWDNYSLYQKLDLGITDSNKNITFTPKKRVYKNNERKVSIVFELKNQRKIDITQTKDREIINFLHGIIRFLKYSNRKMFFSSFKFYRAAVEELIRSTYKKKYNQQLEIITLEHFNEMDKLLSHHTTSLEIENMVISLMKVVDLYVDLYNSDKISRETKKLTKKVLDLLSNEVSYQNK